MTLESGGGVEGRDVRGVEGRDVREEEKRREKRVFYLIDKRISKREMSNICTNKQHKMTIHCLRGS